MASTDNRSNAFLKPDTFVNRAAGFLLLAYFSPLLILIAAAMVMRSRQSPVFVAVERPAHEEAGRNSRFLWRFRCDDSESFFNRFLTQSRLNLLPQLANVAHGDIPLTTALR
jgi:lipopolysaccharide/colanic/teichoic acid biosynthesis glycosyltransferase